MKRAAHRAAALIALSSLSCMVGTPNSLKVHQPRTTHPLRPHPGDPKDAALKQLLADTARVIESQLFAANLLATEPFLGLLSLGAGGERVPQHLVVAAYLGQNPRHPLLPTTVAWGADRGNVNAVTVIVNVGKAGQIVLDAKTKQRWLSDDVLERSCAINTLAHELSHTVALRPGVTNEPLFIDGGRAWATFWGRPMVSYVVGAVAQCTYLQQHGFEQSLEQCVRQRGTNILASGACSCAGHQ